MVIGGDVDSVGCVPCFFALLVFIHSLSRAFLRHSFVLHELVGVGLVLLLALAGLVAGVRGATFTGRRCAAFVATAVGRRVGSVGASAWRHGTDGDGWCGRRWWWEEGSGSVEPLVAKFGNQWSAGPEGG